jgi:quinol monooxygenase YgiN
VAYVSIVRVRARPEGRDTIETGIAQLMAGRRAWRESGDLLASQAVRGDDGANYTLVSVWRDRAAHDRHEDAPGEGEATRRLASALAGPPEETGGEVVADL